MQGCKRCTLSPRLYKCALIKMENLRLNDLLQGNDHQKCQCLGLQWISAEDVSCSGAQNAHEWKKELVQMLRLFQLKQQIISGFCLLHSQHRLSQDFLKTHPQPHTPPAPHTQTHPHTHYIFPQAKPSGLCAVLLVSARGSSVTLSCRLFLFWLVLMFTGSEFSEFTFQISTEAHDKRLPWLSSEVQLAFSPCS